MKGISNYEYPGVFHRNWTFSDLQKELCSWILEVFMFKFCSKSWPETLLSRFWQALMLELYETTSAWMCLVLSWVMRYNAACHWEAFSHALMLAWWGGQTERAARTVTTTKKENTINRTTLSKRQLRGIVSDNIHFQLWKLRLIE